MSQLQVTGEAKIRDIQGPVVANSGVITSLDGAASQYVRGDGTLADFPSSSGGGSSVSYYLNSSVSQGTIDGNAYRELSKEPIIGTGTDIAISSNGYVANYITDANDPDVILLPGGNFNCEFYFSVNNNTGSPTTYAELYKYDGSTFTLLGSSSGVPESINQGTTIAPYYFAIPVATATLATTDRLAIRIYVNVDGRTVTLHTENSHLCQVVTTLSKGMVSLNNLTDQSQYLTTGTSGTNFNIASSGDTHTFNLPVASATNTGKLSSTDWTTFNNKQNAITDPITGTGASGQIAYFNSGTSITSEAAFNYDASTNRLGVNTSVPNATIGANAGTDSGYSLLLKNDNTNYNGLGFGVSSVYGNIIETLKLGSALSRNLTLFNQSGYLSLTEDGNLGLGILTPSTGLDIYNGTSAYLWLHTATSGLGASNGVRLALFNTNGANLRNFEGSFSITAEGDFSVITLGAENFRINSADGSIYQSKVSDAMLKTVSGVLTAAVAGTDYLAPSAISGTTNTVAKFASSSTIGNSNITDTGSLITLGSTTNISSGNFGVGTSSPAVAGVGIDIYSATSAGLRFHTASSGTTVSDGAGINFSAANNLGITNYEAGAIDIVTNGNSGVYINSSGYVGISGATPSTALTVNGAITQSSVTSSLLKTNSSGTIIAAVAGTDYVAPSALSGYLPLTGGNITGNLTIGSPASALAQFHIYNSSAAATMLVETNSSTDYAEIAARNYNSVATAYYRQYSSSATGTDFGVARGNLAALFSNYASNFAIGTQNGGDLILGTANTERLRVLASGNIGIGTASNISASLTIYTTSAANQLKLAGTAPASVFTESLTSPSYVGVMGLATSSNNFLTGSIAGDFVIANQKNFSILFGTGSTTTEKMRLTYDGKLLLGTTTEISGVKFLFTDTAPILGIQSNTTGSVYLRMYQGVNVVSSMFYNNSTSTLTISNNNAGIQFNTSGVTNAFNLSSTGAATFSNSLTASGTNVAILSPSLGTNSSVYTQIGRDNSTVNNAGEVSFKYVGSGSTSNMISLGFYGNGQLLNVLANGNIGFGIINPSAILHTYSSNLGDSGGIRITNGGAGGNDYRIWPTANVNGEGAGKLIITNNGGNRVAISSGGNISIGTTGEYSKLTVMGDITVNIGQGWYTNTYYAGGFNYLSNGYAGYFAMNSGDGSFVWTTAPSGTAGNVATLTERMRITSGEQIHPKRLEIIPNAVTCVPCSTV